MAEMAEARQHARYPVNLTVDYSTRDAFFGNHVMNLSRGGIFIATEDPLPVQSELDLVLALPQRDECIKARGRVVWNYDIRKGTSRVVPGMGIKFVEMAPADAERLTEYLATLQRARSQRRASIEERSAAAGDVTDLPEGPLDARRQAT